MHLRYLLLVIPLILTIGSCKQEKVKTERDILFNEVMDIHDTCMPEMATLNKLKRNIRKTKDTLTDEKLITNSNAMLTSIENAEEGMMQWMRDFNLPKKSDPDQKVIPYLKEEKIKIQKVSDAMYAALKAGNELLKTNQTSSNE